MNNMTFMGIVHVVECSGQASQVLPAIAFLGRAASFFSSPRIKSIGYCRFTQLIYSTGVMQNKKKYSFEVLIKRFAFCINPFSVAY